MLLFRRQGPSLEVLLVHPGGPFWAKRDRGAWSIPKGEYQPEEEPMDAARREFREETGFPPEGDLLPLGEVKQPGGKIVQAWALEGDCDPALLRSNTFLLEWPPRSGKKMTVPEADRAAWFSIPEARERLLPGQAPFLDRLVQILEAGGRKHGRFEA